MINPIQPTILIHEIINKSPNSCDNCLLYSILQFSLSLIPQNIHLKTLISKAASRSAISLFDTQHSAPQVATIIILTYILGPQIFNFLILIYKFSCVTLSVTNLEDMNNNQDNNPVDNISDLSLDIKRMDQNVIRFDTLTPRNMEFTLMGFQAILSGRYLPKCRESVLLQV
jgi:hypothetical protein